MSQTLNAIDLLLADHRRMEALFEKSEKATNGNAEALIVRQICDELTVHMMIEEEIFYPAMLGKIDGATIDEAIVEHDNARLLIRDLLEIGPEERYYQAKVKVLREDVEHHVREEEESGGAFDQAKNSGVDLDRLGAKMDKRKSELLRLLDDAALPMPEMSTMASV